MSWANVGVGRRQKGADCAKTADIAPREASCIGGGDPAQRDHGKLGSGGEGAKCFRPEGSRARMAARGEGRGKERAVGPYGRRARQFRRIMAGGRQQHPARRAQAPPEHGPGEMHPVRPDRFGERAVAGGVETKSASARPRAEAIRPLGADGIVIVPQDDGRARRKRVDNLGGIGDPARVRKECNRERRVSPEARAVERVGGGC